MKKFLFLFSLAASGFGQTPGGNVGVTVDPSNKIAFLHVDSLGRLLLAGAGPGLGLIAPGGNVGIALDPDNNYAFLHVDSGGGLIVSGGGGSYTFSDSIVNTTGTVTLVNDSATPGDSMYYGTNSGGALGYYSLPAGSTAANPSASIAATAVNGSATTYMRSDAAPALGVTGGSLGFSGGNLMLSGDTASPGNNQFYGTNGSGTKGWYQGVSISGTPTANYLTLWNTATQLTSSQYLPAGNFPALTGDVTTSAGALATTVAKIAGVSVGTPTGTTNVVLSNGPTLVAPVLGTPASGTLTNCTGLPAASVVAGALASGMTATTQSTNDSSTKVATTAFVNPATDALGTVTTTATVPWATSTSFSLTNTATDTCTVTFTGATDGVTITVAVTTASTASITWPTVAWSGGSAPTPSANGHVDFYTFKKVGSTIYGSAVLNGY